MENQTIIELRKQSEKLLSTLKPHPREENISQATINFSGYSSLFCTIRDLMKLCALVKIDDDPYVSALIEDNKIDIAGILELAIQLMPREEGEFLDEARMLLKADPPQTEILPMYNYSTMVVLDKAS